MIKSLFGNVAHAIVTLISIVLIICVIFFSKQANQVDLKVGEVSSQDIYAPRAIIDTVTTEANRQEARDAIEEIYVIDSDKTEHSLKNIRKFFDTASQVRSEKETLGDVAVNELVEKSNIKISNKTAEAIIGASNGQFVQLESLIKSLEFVMNDGVTTKEDGISRCLIKAQELNLSKNQIKAAEEIVSLTITENKVYDKKATEEKRNKAAETVPEQEYKKNQTIVHKGAVVTQAQYAMISELGLLKGSSPITTTYAVGICIFIAIAFLILLFYAPKQKRADSSTAPIAAVTAFLIVLLIFYGSKYIPERMNPLIPAGLFPGIVAIFSTPQTAIMSNMLLSVFCALAFEANWGYTVCLIIAGTVSSYCFSTVKRRSHLLPASFVSSLFYGFVFCGMSLIETSSAGTAVSSFFKGFGGGFLSGLITIGSLPLLEWIFNATTPMKLSELANPENKLLKKLLVEAPGTYHHSLTVANISEIAARSIKADSLLARVGAYYHDIGKLRHPLFFKENQYDRNAHDSLSPEESSALIINHVTDGADIAEKNHLPKSIRDIIAQHHGKTTTGYFLIRAKELDPDVDVSKFTYPGPVPKTKEAAIVMLADSCEAAVRSIDEKSEAKIETMVRKIVTDRVNSGQLSQCNMTFAELETIIKVIIKTLGGYFHERIKYE